MTTYDQHLRTSVSGNFYLGGDHLVHRGYGSMQLIGPGHWYRPADPAEAQCVFRRAIDSGVTT
jgi:hypothetical protein